MAKTFTDWKSYLMHYGIKGMRWNHHKPDIQEFAGTGRPAARPVIVRAPARRPAVQQTPSSAQQQQAAAAKAKMDAASSFLTTEYKPEPTKAEAYSDRMAKVKARAENIRATVGGRDKMRETLNSIPDDISDMSPSEQEYWINKADAVEKMFNDYEKEMREVDKSIRKAAKHYN